MVNHTAQQCARNRNQSFFKLIPRNLFGVSPRSVQDRFLDPPVVNKSRSIPSFGGTRRCIRCSFNEEVDRHLAPHPTAMPVLLWVKHLSITESHRTCESTRWAALAAGYCSSLELPETDGKTTAPAVPLWAVVISEFL